MRSAPATLRRLARLWPLLALVLFALGAGGGCAYFNTYSNARRYFKQAENMQRTPDGKITPNARKAYDDSIEKCKKLMELYPDSKYVDDALFLMSRAYFEKSEYGSCLRRLDELEERFPDHEWREQALYMRGVCDLENGDESRAIADLDRLQEEFPKSKHLAEGMFRRAEAEYRLGNWDDAIGAYQRLLESFKQSEFNDEARLKIALTQRELGQDSLAVETVAVLAEKGRNRRTVFEGQLAAAEILFDQHRYTECGALLGELEPVAENFQSRGPVLLLQARLVEADGDLEKAATQFENVATEFPRSNSAAEAWYRIGLIRQNREHDLEQAIVAYDNARKEVPRSLFADLAGTKSKAVQEVIDFRAQSGEEAPDSSAAQLQFRLAENQLLRLEDPEAALAEYGKVLEDYPDSPLASQAAYALAYINRYSLADTLAARRAVALLLERYPDSDSARYVEGWLDALGPAQ